MIDRMNGTGNALMDVDRLLHDFYRSEMPAPWPQFAVPTQVAARRPAPRFTRSVFRLALAASVVLALLAYWGVSGVFPKNSPGPGVGGPEISMPINHRMLPIEKLRTPAGNDAQLFEEGLPNGQGQVINIIGPSSSKAPR